MEIRGLLTRKRIFKIIIWLGTTFIVYTAINSAYLRWKSYGQVKDFLVNAANRVISDLKYVDNKWDTSSYLSDGEITSDNPLYIFTIEGFLIDRIKNVNGFLDTADFNYVNSFQNFTTITSPINEVWRAYSLPVLNDESDTVGSILVAVLYPKLSALKEIDNDLLVSANKIKSLLIFKDGQLKTKDSSFPTIDYSISYIVVDKFNKIILEQGGPPAYIDRSYIREFINNNSFEKIQDEITKEEYLITKKTILKKNETPIGVVIVGQSLRTLNQVLMNQIFFSLLSGLFLFVSIALIGLYLFGPELSLFIDEKVKQHLIKKNSPKLLNPRIISFNEDNHVILFDKYNLNIIPDTNQYYFCKKLFSKPQKKWENDELLDNFIGNKENPRAVYDCYFSLNKKIKQKIGRNLFINEGRKFSFNKDLIKKVKSQFNMARI